jgi:hypothetical protein
MKKQILLATSLLLIVPFCMGQQVQNGSFEEWEQIPSINLEEPVNWSSIKTSDGGSIINNAAPKVWDKSTDARTGLYSVELTNKSAFNIVATGTISNGRYHAEFNPQAGYAFTDPNDPQWNTPITAKPDSLTGWYKQTPSGEDFSTVRVLVHKGYAKIPDSTFSNWIGIGNMDMPTGVVGEWTRFSIPIDYLNNDTPEYVLIILTAGNGTNAVAGSVAWFDDIELVYNDLGIQDEMLASEYHVFIRNSTLYIQNIPLHILQSSDIEIRDISGRSVWKGKTQTYEIPLGKVLNPGIYIFRMHLSGESYSRKVYVR